MRLLRYGPAGSERPGLLHHDGSVRDLAGSIADLDGDALSSDSLARLSRLPAADLPIVRAPARLGVPIAGIRKIIGVGLNYRDHAAEVGRPTTPEPSLFLKATSSLCGPDDDLVMPRDGRALDYEVELAVVISRRGVYIDTEHAMDHVAGYCLAIDFSEREFQFNRGGQGFKGKSADTFGPLGPWFVPRHDSADPSGFTLRLAVNGEERQHGRTADMIFPVPDLVAYCSRFMSLDSGDVILTGTPAGVGHGHVPPRYLVPGDVVEASIDGLGTQRHVVTAPD